MSSATCPHCNEPAFSSAEFNRPWTCPTCGESVVPDVYFQTDAEIMLANAARVAGEDNPSPRGRNSILDRYFKYWTVIEEN